MQQLRLAYHHCKLYLLGRMLESLVCVWLMVGMVLGLGAASQASAHEDESTPTALKRLSIEQLMDVEVTSVSKTRESLLNAAAAVSIVTDEDIRRSGATTVPEALRFVPGLFVARVTSNSWSVSSRGFSGVNSQELLVLSDTRSIYTPLFSGVFWDVQDYLMDDIDRIEVIRGPGGSLWGSNAVNGVINITTKPAQDTQGGHFEAETGTQEHVTTALRYGGQLGDDAYFRVFGKFTDQDAELDPPGASPDNWRLGHVGFRSDWQAGPQDALTVQGDLYDGDIGLVAPSVTVINRPSPTGRLVTRVSGGDVLGRWRHTFDSTSDMQLRLYYDHTHRSDPSFLDDLDTIDLDFQHRFLLARRHEITWGLSYRLLDDRDQGKGVFALNPPSARDHLYSGFLQDQVSLGQTVRVTIGTKLEHNDYSGYEVQPSIRVAWDLAEARTFWGAISRAVRVPDRLERDVDIDATDPTAPVVARLVGNSQFRAEELLAFELGYRWQLAPSLSFDLATFYNRYTGLASLEFATPYVDPNTGRTIIPVVDRNLTDGRAGGFETLVTYSPLLNWRLSLDYSYIDMSLTAHGMDLNRGQLVEGSTPRNQLGLRSYLDLPRGLQLDVQFRALAALTKLPASVTGDRIPAYRELDVRLGWRLGHHALLSLDGQDLLHAHHVEFGAPYERSSIRRSVYGKITWEF
jgi:iron complex outermembrane receptor protein